MTKTLMNLIQKMKQQMAEKTIDDVKMMLRDGTAYNSFYSSRHYEPERFMNGWSAIPYTSTARLIKGNNSEIEKRNPENKGPKPLEPGDAYA